MIRRALLHLRRCSDFDTIGSAIDVRQYWGSYFIYITTESDELTQKRCNSSALFFLIAELKTKFFTLEENYKPFAARNFNIWLLVESNR